MLPVALNVPVTLAPVVVATNVLVPLGAKLTLPLAPVMILNAPVSTILPLVSKLPPVMLPVAFNVPAMFAPVVVNTATLATPPTLMFALPSGVCMSKDVVPFCTRSPRMLPDKLAFPVTLRLPVIAIPLLDITATVAPATLASMLPPLANTCTWLVPLEILVASRPTNPFVA